MANKHIYRARWHDYRSRCIYMITLSKRSGVPDFGDITGYCFISPGLSGSTDVRLTDLGKLVKDAIIGIQKVEPAIKLLAYVVMPDHVHILIFVQRELSTPLGNIIAALKVRVNKACNIQSVFEQGFNDQILKKTRSLEVLFRYIRENPWRLAVRRALPEYFRRVRRVMIGGREYEAYGNMQLLDNPFKEQVVVHRADTEETRVANRSRWLHTAANGGVLVSPFISPAEKEVRVAAEGVDGKIILIRHEGFAERYKPDAHDFGLCLSGRLLIISCGALSTQDLDRAACLQMNGLAAVVASYPQ